VGQHRILIVEDDERIGSSLLRAFGGSGYDAVWERTGQGGVDSVTGCRPDLVLLDLGLPDVDGIEACGRIHELDPSIDVIMLTARDDELDVVVGLDAGAVDYVAKPFKLAELLARVRAQLRRRDTTQRERLSAGDLMVDVAARRVSLAGVEVELRAKEFDLLARLAEDAGVAVTRETLMSDVWDEHWFGSTKTLDFHIAALRRKLDVPDRPSRITTLRGVGYRLETP
jgi:DNA-binding response OmpR family regulator